MPTYFADHAGSLSFPTERDDGTGLRRAQKGAIFAVGSHFSLSRANALVSMPTGTGKTGVLMMIPYMLAASRALVITPSRMVRDQIAEEFRTLSLLKRLTVLPAETPSPSVQAVEAKILRQEQWETLTDADVVVATPMGSSPAIDDIPHPPADLFDLLLIDEAHHSPARTWQALMESFPHARRVLFTATPFRRDRQQLPGEFVYEFPLREALRDRVFGSIRFIGCEPDPDVSNDIVIARRTEETYSQDRKSELNHRVMVRTDSRTRAAELSAVYQENTSLRLATIHGQHSLSHVRRTVQQIRDDNLDGVICVDMFGEGVDMPQLKIAAIHSPHRSLAVTLQFIGRFARTGGERLGEAKFIAIPEEIETETKALYQQGAVWAELVTNLADSRVAGERVLRQQIGSFSPEYHAPQDVDLTLSIIKPWYHSKVFHVHGRVDLRNELSFAGTLTAVQQFVSDEMRCAVYVCQNVQKPRWLEVPSLLDVEHYLFILFYDEATRLLFINSSIKTEEMYSQIADAVVDGPFRGVSTATINRCLRTLRNPAFFNVGMKSRLFGNQVESYRIISGGNADRAVSNTDAQIFDRGHVFGSGETDEGSVTLGISTLSKVWSNRTGFVPEYVGWCQAIAGQLSDLAPVVTGSRIDLLATGEEVAEIPTVVIGAAWHETAFKTTPLVTVDDMPDESIELLSLDIHIEQSSPEVVQLTLAGFGDPIPVMFRISGNPYFEITSPRRFAITSRGGTSGTLSEYLNSFGLHLYLADFSRVYRNQLFRSNLRIAALPNEAFESSDWAARGVDIRREFGNAGASASIHDGLEDILVRSAASVVVYDHRSGEIADFVALHREGDAIVCEVFHCKGAGGPRPGSRVGDAYEVAGQVIKSVPHARSASTLKTDLVRRINSGSCLKKGTLQELEQILDAAEQGRFEFRVRLVQPGISVSGMTEPVSRVLAAAYDYVRATTGFTPKFWVSE